MFEWYWQAQECYVFLHDLSTDAPDEVAQCEWFSRDWTLQELLVPPFVIFCSSGWTIIGHKGRRTRPVGRRESKSIAPLISQLSKITGIRECYLETLNIYLTKASIAECMSWVSRRQTARLEDMAYCMLGIFKINMPLLYGQGPRAFQRLQ